MRTLARMVLIKQTTTKKKGILHRDSARNDADKFDFTHEIIGIGDSCKRKIAIGDIPIFSSYVQFSAVKVLEKTSTGMVTLVCVHERDIIGIDNPEEKESLDGIVFN